MLRLVVVELSTVRKTMAWMHVGTRQLSILEVDGLNLNGSPRLRLRADTVLGPCGLPGTPNVLGPTGSSRLPMSARLIWPPVR